MFAKLVAWVLSRIKLSRSRNQAQKELQAELSARARLRCHTAFTANCSFVLPFKETNSAWNACNAPLHVSPVNVSVFRNKLASCWHKSGSKQDTCFAIDSNRLIDSSRTLRQ